MSVLKVGRFFSELTIPKIVVSSLFSPVKKRNILCWSEHV